MSNGHNKYFAFISYKREDEEWAVWFHHELENYHLPISLNGRSDLPTEFRPVFRDIDELKAGNLPEQIHEALASSTYLIVVCSPNSAKSEWVNKEIIDFIDIGKAKGIDNIRNIFPFIVDGHPHSKDAGDECFPKALLNLSDKEERIGGNVNESGRDMAFVKVLSGMLPSVEFSELWNRYERDKAEEERLKREERERFLRVQSRLIAEKAINITHNSPIAQLLALETLPKDLSHPDRPLTLEAERALRESTFRHDIILRGYTFNISDISFSPDGKLLASIDTSSIRIWNADTGEVIRVIAPKHYAGHCVQFTPDNKTIVSAFGDGAIVMWNIDGEDPIMELDFNQTFQTQRPAVCINSMAISPGGNKMAISTSEGDIFVINFETERTSSVEIEPILSIEFNSDGTMLASTSEAGLQIWNLEDGSNASLGLNDGVELEFAHASFSPDGNIVAFSFDSAVAIVNVFKDGELKTFDGGNNSFVHVSFCDNGKSIVAVSKNGEITIWDVETQRTIYRNTNENITDDVCRACYSGQTMRVGFVVDEKTIVIQSIRTTTYYNSFILREDRVGAISYSPDGTTLLTSSAEGEKGELTLWDINTGLIKQRLTGHTDKVLSASFSPNGHLIVSSSHDGSVRLWDAFSGKMLKSLQAMEAIGKHTAFTNAIFSPDGKLVAASLYTGWIILWDYDSGKVIQKIFHCGNPILAIDFSPDGSRIATGGVTAHVASTGETFQDIRVWDTGSGELKAVLDGHTGFINSIRYSPDGRRILSSSNDKSIICWDADTASIIWRNRSFSEKVLSLRYRNDGKYFVAITSDYEKPIVVCDSQEGMILAVYRDLVDPANAVTFSPDGRYIAADIANGVIAIWTFPELQELIRQTRERLNGRELTHQERKQYYLE